MHMSRQLSCRDMCKIVAWSDKYFTSKSNPKFYKIWILSTFVKWVPNVHPNEMCIWSDLNKQYFSL